MNIETITMPQRAAREAFLTYKRSIRDRHNAEDEAVMRGYRAMARGSALLDVNQAMRVGGQDDLGRPKLAICRADYKWCFLRWWGERARFIGTHSETWEVTMRLAARKNNSVSLIPGIFERQRIRGELQPRPEARALIPMVPPQYRPRAAMSNYHILWEADWQAVPVDPILLKHLGGSLYVVLAQWDLTPLEQAVLAGRLAE